MTKNKLDELKRILFNLNRVKSIQYFFEKNNIRGHWHVADSCPIAQYLREKGYYCTINKTYCKYAGHIIKLSPKISNFVCNFDNGLYPKLQKF